MLIELLSQANYVSFNVKLAHVIGLDAAIYLSQLLDINEKAVRKNKTDGEFFNVDRKYITSRTTIKDSEQKSIDTQLEKIGILSKKADKPNSIAIDITTLTSILASPDEDLLKDISKIAQPKKQSKGELIKDNLKQMIYCSDTDLYEAFCEWIEAVMTKDGFMTGAAVKIGQEVVAKFAGNNKTIALNVVQTATLHAYRDMTWAIAAYQKDYANNNYMTATTYQPQQIHPAASQQFVPKVRVSDEIF